MKGRLGSGLLNPLVAAQVRLSLRAHYGGGLLIVVSPIQNFEYKVWHESGHFLIAFF
jgi:hypothetical protein